MKFRLLIALFFFILVRQVSAQDTLLLHYSKSITKEELSAHVYKLASDEFEGRFTGSRGQMKAQKYITNEFESYGLQKPEISGIPSFTQDFYLDECRWKDQRMLVNGEELIVGKDFLFLSDPVDINGDYPLVFAGFGIDDPVYSDFGEIDVKGKVMLAFAGEPKNKDGISCISGKKESSKKSYYFSKAAQASNRGAEGLFIISRKKSNYRNYLKNRDYYDPKPKISYPDDEDDSLVHKNAFTAYMNVKTAARILNQKPKSLLAALHEMESGEKTTAGRFTGQASLIALSECQAFPTANVVGIVEGTDLKSQAVVVVAHYDHLGRDHNGIYHGADDNASGTASVMELAEAFALAAKDGVRPRRTVIFLAVSGEELGLYGSKYYSQHPVISLDSTFACLNIDMIGRVGRKMESNPGYISGYVYLSQDLLEVSQESCRAAVPDLEDRIEYRKNIRGGSDHYYFATNGIPSIFYFEGFHDDYHEITDTADKILYDRMEQIVRAIFVTTWELANREEKLEAGN